MFQKKTHRFLNEAGDPGSTGGGAPAGGTPPAGGEGGAAPAAQPTSTVMSRGAGGDPAAWNAPDKYLVKNGDAIDWQATARKIDEGRSHLEKRFGAGDVPPADVSGYKVAVPEAHAEALKEWDLAKDEKLQGFVSGAHKLGFTQQQLDHVLGSYADLVAQAKGAQLSPEDAAKKAEGDAAKALGEVWKDQAEFDKNVGLAFQASQKLAAKLGADFDEFNAALGNNPMFLRMAAALAPEMQEDTPQGTQQSAGSSLDWEAKRAELVGQRDALPQGDPRRQVIAQQLNAHYEKRYPSKAA